MHQIQGSARLSESARYYQDVTLPMDACNRELCTS
jgi:hypothetical protein